MKLQVLERLTLLMLLPKEGDFTTLKLVRKLRENLSFSEEEHAALNFRREEESLRWDIPTDRPDIILKEVPIGKKAEKIIAEALEKLNNDKKLEEAHFSLYEKFCVSEGDAEETE